MAMFGKVQDLFRIVQTPSRLQRGLALLLDYKAGRHPKWKTALEEMKPGDKTEIPIQGQVLFAILQCYQPKPRAEGRFEAHERHTDLQYLTAGTEWIEVCHLYERLPAPAYDANGNVFFPLGDPASASRVRLAAGDVAVLLPVDAHAPCLRVEGAPEEPVRKIVIKIKDAHLPERPNP